MGVTFKRRLETRIRGRCVEIKGKVTWSRRNSRCEGSERTTHLPYLREERGSTLLEHHEQKTEWKEVRSGETRGARSGI